MRRSAYGCVSPNEDAYQSAYYMKVVEKINKNPLSTYSCPYMDSPWSYGGYGLQKWIEVYMDV